MIHRFIDCVIDLSFSDVLRLKSELVESTPQTFSARPARLTRGRRMGIESHNAHFFVIAQTTPEQVFYCAPGRIREISRQVDRDVFHCGLLLTILAAPIASRGRDSSLYQNCIKTRSHLASWRC